MGFVDHDHVPACRRQADDPVTVESLDTAVACERAGPVSEQYRSDAPIRAAGREFGRWTVTATVFPGARCAYYDCHFINAVEPFLSDYRSIGLTVPVPAAAPAAKVFRPY